MQGPFLFLVIMKRKGRMAVYTGTKWVRGLCSDALQHGQFHRVSDLLGDLLTSKVLKSGAFDEVCRKLKQSEYKLRHLSVYGIPHLVRVCMVTRAIIRGVGDDGLWSLDSNAWSVHLRNMHRHSTSHIFHMLGVDDLDDALAMQVSVREFATRVWSSRVAAIFFPVDR